MLGRTQPFDLPADRAVALRGENVHDLRWWAADEIRLSGILTNPRNHVHIVATLVRQNRRTASAWGDYW